MILRLFTAFPIEPAVQDQLGRLIATLKERDRGVKWVAAHNIHLTIRFLGDTDEKMIPDLKEIIDRAATGFERFEGTIDQLGAFPNLSRPRVIWVGMSGPLKGLSDLAGRMEKAVRKAGYQPERKKFSPHFTLGRVRREPLSEELRTILREHRLTPIPIKLDRVSLIKSTLTPAGPIYDALYEKGLGRP
jgi:2'-5' RNA ligase